MGIYDSGVVAIESLRDLVAKKVEDKEKEKEDGVGTRRNGVARSGK